MKKIGLFITSIILVFGLVACAGKTTAPTTARQNPSIVGVTDKTIEAGSIFRSLEGISATDQDGNTLEVTYSGIVDPNTVGEYVLTYKATDDYGLSATETCTITVIKTDKSAPLLTGAGDVEIVVGGSFDKTAGVSAIDTVDGNLTSKIEITGDVDTFVPGTYKVNYSVKDEAGNEAKKERTVTVSLGAFIFAEDGAVTENAVTGEINVQEYGYGIVKVVVSVTEDKTGSVSIDGFTGGTDVALKAGNNDVYLSYTVVAETMEVTLPENLSVTVTNCEFVSYTIGKPDDITAPVVTFSAVFTAETDQTIYLPSKINDLTLTADEVLDFIKVLTGVSVLDNRDSYLIPQVLDEIDFTNTTSVQSIKIGAEDLSGNEGSKAVNIKVVDPVCVDNLKPSALYDDYYQLTQQLGKTGLTLEDVVENNTWIRYVENATFSEADGIDTITDTNYTGFYYSNKLQYLFGQDISYGNYYVVSITIKAATENRNFMMRFYQGLGAEPWSENFMGHQNAERTAYAAEYTTYNFIFKYNLEFNQTKNFGTVLEFDFGPFNYSTLAEGNTLLISDFRIYALGGEVESPYTK